jgi:hypothetical protein
LHAILCTISYTVSGAPLRNRISLFVRFLKIGYVYLKTDSGLVSTRKLSYLFTPQLKMDQGLMLCAPSCIVGSCKTSFFWFFSLPGISPGSTWATRLSWWSWRSLSLFLQEALTIVTIDKKKNNGCRKHTDFHPLCAFAYH